MDYSLEDLIDIRLLQDLQEKLNAICPFPSSINDNEGKILTAVAWQDICTKFHHKHPDCLKECTKSDKYILEHLKDAKPAVSYKCPHGLVDNAIPIIIDGKHLGNFFTGQFFLEKPDLDFFKKQAKKYGFDEKAYLDAVEQVPIWTNEKLIQYLDFIKGFIEVIAGMGLKNLKEIETKRLLQKYENRLNYYFYKSPIAGMELDRNFVVTKWTEGAEKVFGWTAEEIIGKSILDLKIIYEPEIGTVNRILDKLQKSQDECVISVNRNCRKDGKLITCEWYNTILKDEQGNLMYVMAEALDITDRLHSEELLQLSEARHSSMIANISDVIGIIGLDGIMKYKSPNIEKWFGWKPEDLVGTDGWLTVHPDDLERIRREFHKLIQEDNAVNMVEYRYLCKDGSYKTIELTAKNLINDPNIGGILMNYHDVSERQKIEKELKRQKHFYEQMFMQSSVSTQILDNDGWCERINTKLSEIFGVEPMNIEGKVYNIFKDEAIIRNGIVPFLERVFKEGKTSEWEVLFDIGEAAESQNIDVKEKKKVWYHNWSYPIFDESGKVTNVIIQHQNVSEQKYIEQELIKSKEKAEETAKRLQLALISGQFGIWEWNVRDNTIIWDEKMIELYGTSRETFKSNIDVWRNSLHPEDKERALVECGSALKGEHDFNTIFRVLHPDGKVLFLRAYGIVIRDENGNPIRMLGINRDVTSEEQTKHELIKAKEKAEESDRLKSAFLANMSHEIRTPMNGILGFTNLLKNPDITGDKQLKFIDIIEKSGERMLNTINNIVDISKIESGLMHLSNKETNINEQLQFAYNFFKPETEKRGLHLVVSYELPEDKAIIRTDNEKLYSILINLIKNAIKYTDRGSIEIGYNFNETQRSSSGNQDKYLKFYVRDTGIGIPPENQKIIFQRFIQTEVGYTRIYEGTGLGLAIAKSYIEMLGGQIWVESEVDKGSVFYFTIPYNQVPVKESSSKIEETDTPLKKLKVLIAEDDKPSRELLEIQIENLCKEIIFAENGFDALELCRKHPDLDLILMDIQMPKMNGFEATEKIRQFNSEVVIIAQTAYGFSYDEEKAIKAGCSDYISKPINYKRLFEKIERHLKETNSLHT